MIQNLVIPGQVENWNLITNLGKLSIMSIPEKMKKLMNVLTSNYRCRLYVNFIFGMSTFLKFVWNIVKGMLDEYTVKKLRFVDFAKLDEVFEFIHPSQVEQRFGGTAMNVQPGYFFPPNFPSSQYQLNGVNVKDVIISEEEYKERVKNNQVTAPNREIAKEIAREIAREIEQEEELKKELELQEQEKRRQEDLKKQIEENNKQSKK
jgi:hypothetical protein